MKPGEYTLKAMDEIRVIDNGIGGNKGVYSSHPVYLVREKSGNFHVIFYKNPTSTDAIITSNSITLKSVNYFIFTSSNRLW